MKVIGLAGPAGSGKSAVARELARRPGASWLNLDRLAWSTYDRGTPTFNALVVRFGVEILTPKGCIDRAALARRAFADPAAKRDLDRIVHPAVNEALARTVEEERREGCETLLVEGALLANSPDVDRSLFDAILWLDAPRETREARLRGEGRSHHAARNARLSPPRTVVRIDADAPLALVIDRVWQAIQAAGSTRLH